MLVTLDREDWPPTNPMRWVRKQTWEAIDASHNCIRHLVGEQPCIHLYGLMEQEKKRLRKAGNRPYPLVHERNILTIINHESLHCAMQTLLGFDFDDTLDEIVPDIDLTRKFLEVA